MPGTIRTVGAAAEVARGFIEDLRAFYAEPNSIKKDVIAARQLRALRDYQGPRERKLSLSDVKDMFEQMRDHVGPASGNFICAACP